MEELGRRGLIKPFQVLLKAMPGMMAWIDELSFVGN
jgi:hypothetical protein